MQVTVHSLTVETPNASPPVTQVFATNDEVIESLLLNHADGMDYTADNVIENLCNDGYCLYIDEHTVTVPDPTPQQPSAGESHWIHR